jgi:hypothetical protein
MRSLAISVLFAASGAAAEPTPAAPAGPASCAAAAAQGLLSRYHQEATRPDDAAALATLQDLRARCLPALPPARRYWVLSELAALLHKLHRDAECLTVLDEVPEVDGPPPAARMGEAIAYNEGACGHYIPACDYRTDKGCEPKVDEVLRRDASPRFRQKDCPIPGHAEGVQVPLAGAATACLELAPAPRRQSPPSDGLPCRLPPRLVLLTRDAVGKVRTRGLAAPQDSVLGDSSDGCNLQRVMARSDDARTLVRLTSGGIGRDCAGGTAANYLDEYLSWRDGKLLFKVSRSVGFH